MLISSSSFYGSPLVPLSPYADGHGRISPVSPVTRRDGTQVAHGEEDQVDSPRLMLPKDTAGFSAAALEALAREAGPAQQTIGGKDPLKTEQEQATQEAEANTEELNDSEKEQVRKLKARDAEVRAHEAAHAAAAGALASGGPSFHYERGPDGTRYAVGGEVGISLGTGSTPEERAANAAKAQRAANAPANPSGQDRAVAAKASQIAASARAEISKAKLQESQTAQPETASSEGAGSQGAANAQAAQKSEQQDARKAQTLQMARRTEAYRDISQAVSGRSTTVLPTHAEKPRVMELDKPVVPCEASGAPHGNHGMPLLNSWLTRNTPHPVQVR